MLGRRYGELGENGPVRARQVLSLDVNGDGRPDIAELEPDPSNPGRYRWLWLQNNGGGNFTLGGVLYSDLEPAAAVVSFDVNGDGRPDIAELEPDPSNPGRYRWLWLQNNGGGNFTLGGVLFSDLLEPLQAVSLDVNGDGRPDIAELEPDPSNPGRYRWLWLQNNGGGNFTLGGVLFSDLLEPLQAVSLDVNGDGRPDIAELEPDPSNPGRYRWLWLQNNGGGNFTLGGVLFSDLLEPLQAVSLDVNGDGRPDIAELEPDPSNPGRYRWLWLQNNGGGNFAVGGVAFSDLQPAAAAVTIDATGSGRSDLAELEPDPANAGRQEWLWLQNNGGGNFTDGVLYSDLEQPVQALALDVNGDGKPDIAELEPDPSNPGRYRWLWLQNNGGGNFTVGGVLYSDLEQPVQALALDVNGDGKPDIAELEPDPSNPGRYRWLWLQNNGGGNFTVGGVLYSDLEQPVQALALDVNGDGKPDIAELEPDPSNPGRYRWLWLQNNGGGNFTVGGVLYSDLEQPVQALALDVNGDGKPDIAELEPDPSNPGRYRWLWLQNNGGGNFTVGGVLYSDLEQPVQALALDVNGDGKPDIAELEPDPSNPGRYRWLWLQNNGGGNFTVGGVLYSDLEQPVQALALDVNGDGKPDIAELEPDPLNAGRFEWTWLRNSGGGSFTTQGGVLFNALE